MIKDLYHKNKEIINYIMIGGMTTLISLLSYFILVYTIFNPNYPLQLQFANIFSWILAVAFAYTANRIFVFQSRNKNKILEMTKFVLSRLSTLLIEMFFMFCFVSVLHINDKISKIIVQVIVFICNYILSKFLVFNNK